MTPYDNAHEEEKLNSDKSTLPAKPSRAEAEAAVETLLKWAGDDPSRELRAPDPLLEDDEQLAS